MKEAGSRAVQTIVLGFAVLLFGPWLNEVAPWLGLFWAEVVAIAFTALLTEALMLFVIVPTILHLEWNDESNPNPLHDLVVSAAALNSQQALFEMAVRVEFGGVLNRWLFRQAQKRGLRMRVEFPSAPVYFTVNLSTPVREVGKTVSEVQRGSYGVDVLLDSEPSEDTWVWAKVLLQPVPPITVVTNRRFALRLRLHASGRFGTLCAKVIRKRPSADGVTLHR